MKRYQSVFTCFSIVAVAFLSGCTGASLTTWKSKGLMILLRTLWRHLPLS